LNYTSPWYFNFYSESLGSFHYLNKAGAVWGPSWDTADEELRQWDRDIVKYWGEMVDDRPEEAKIAGVHVSRSLALVISANGVTNMIWQRCSYIQYLSVMSTRFKAIADR
jgi:hypothetical protein